MRLLLVEDDALLSGRLRGELQRAGFAVDVADNGVDAGFMGESEPYDMVVLISGCPTAPGWTCCAAGARPAIRCRC